MRRTTLFLLALLPATWATAQFYPTTTATPPPPAAATHDSREMLTWARQQAVRVDSTLADAVHSPDQSFLILRMLEAWHDFDAVAHAGLYCHEARKSAERGRYQCDLINYRLEDNLTALRLRAKEARLQAIRLRDAADACRLKTLTSEAGAPVSVLLSDSEIVAHDLEDALAVSDFHIMAQKLEHVQRILHDMEYLAATLPNCRATRDHVRAALTHATNALLSDNWEPAAGHIRLTLAEVRAVQGLSGCH